ncbi:MAG: hypothetical protein CML96_06900 [Rhodobiaceae bacterium]|nr:hypothetical protein [Rhodobiaceae bacterium]|tara:strand:+ start:9114 stop:9545 length:432 start_codon:yes stop_codon:yes gene_type:complete
MSGGLKLKAFDEESLIILSSLTQDSIIKINELGYDNSAKRFAVLMNRYCHEKEGAKRIRSAIHFDYINKVKTKSINLDTKDETLSLLAIRFESENKPSGSIILEFSGNKAINLETENIEAFLTDVGDPWEVKNKPDHDKEKNA